MDKSSKHAAMRARFPFAAAITDELRAVFGPQIAPTHMTEGADEWGKKRDESRYKIVSWDAKGNSVRKDIDHGF